MGYRVGMAEDGSTGAGTAVGGDGAETERKNGRQIREAGHRNRTAWRSDRVREAREWYGPKPAEADDDLEADAVDAAVVTAETSDETDATEDLGTVDNLDAIEELADEIAILSAHIHAAEHRLLTLIAEYDRREGWKTGEYRNCAHWLLFRTGIDLGSARERVRVARALEVLPETGAAMARGELSFSKVRALTRIANADNEGELLEFATANTAHQLEKLVRGWRDLGRHDEAKREELRHASRCFSIFPDGRGMYAVRGTLDPEVGAMLMRAIDAANQALFREEARRSPLEPETTPEQRRADAVGLVAERALATGLGVSDRTSEAGGEVDVDAVSGCAHPPHPPASAPISGSRASRTQIVLYLDTDTLVSGREPGRSNLDDGTRVAAATSRRLACDACVVPMKTDPDGEILDVGRSTRTVPPSIRRALEARDGGCRFPGCGLRFTDAHHVEHWAEGGETRLSNLVLLCHFHHRAVHEDGFSVRFLAPDELKFYTPEGWPMGSTPPRVVVSHSDPVVALIHANRRRGVRPHRRSGAATYERESDIPDTLLFRAFEAVEQRGR